MLIIVEWRGVGRLNTMRLYASLSIIFLLAFGLYQNEVATPVFTIMIYFSMLPLLGLVNAYSSESYIPMTSEPKQYILSIVDILRGVAVVL